MVEAPLALQQTLTIPQDHYDACAAAASPTPTVGNAAGNTVDLLDLAGEPAPPPRLPDGFTARGIVALVFSCIAGILGVAVVAWYGLVGEGESPKEAGLVSSEDDGVLQQGASGSSSGNAVGADGRPMEQVTVTSGGGNGVSRT